MFKKCMLVVSCMGLCGLLTAADNTAETAVIAPSVLADTQTAVQEAKPVVKEIINAPAEKKSLWRKVKDWDCSDYQDKINECEGERKHLKKLADSQNQIKQNLAASCRDIKNIPDGKKVDTETLWLCWGDDNSSLQQCKKDKDNLRLSLTTQCEVEKKALSDQFNEKEKACQNEKRTESAIWAREKMTLNQQCETDKEILNNQWNKKQGKWNSEKRDMQEKCQQEKEDLERQYGSEKVDLKNECEKKQDRLLRQCGEEKQDERNKWYEKQSEWKQKERELEAELKAVKADRQTYLSSWETCTASMSNTVTDIVPNTQKCVDLEQVLNERNNELDKTSKSLEAAQKELSYLTSPQYKMKQRVENILIALLGAVAGLLLGWLAGRFKKTDKPENQSKKKK